MTPDDLSGLSSTDLAVLTVLLETPGRVMGRDTILRRAALTHCNPRRCDSSIVSLRRVLGADAITTVRRRGWAITPEGEASARMIPVLFQEPGTPT